MRNITNNSKIIFHIDMNAFFASVAQIKKPYLKGKPFAIGREYGTRGVLSTASYEARKYGIHSAMSIVEARRLLPSLIIVELSHKEIQYYHEIFVNVLGEYSKLVEVASVDEAYIDVTEKSNVMHPIDIAKEIQNRLLNDYSLPCSIGIAPTLFLAKMASDMKKPLGITILRKREIQDVLYPLSIKEVYGIGKKTYPSLIKNGIETIKDFMDPLNSKLIIELIGENQYKSSYNCLIGKSTAIVDPNRYDKNKSISTESTFDASLRFQTDIIFVAKDMLKKVYKRMVLDNYITKTITLVLRDVNFITKNRSKSMEYTKDFNELYYALLELINDNYNDEEIRLVGVGLSNLILETELPQDYNLFNYLTFEEKSSNIDDLLNHFKDKYGNEIISKGMKKKN